MKAIVWKKYGTPDFLELGEVDKPTPADNEVLVKVKAASLNAADWHIIRGKPFLLRFMTGGLLKPKVNIPGADMAGQIEAVGRSVQQFKPGDKVFGDLTDCGWGTFGEYVSVPEEKVALKPDNITFGETAAMPLAAVTALQGLRDKGHIQSGQKVLINGSSGGVGTYAVQIAKAYGAEVTAVCSTGKIDMIRSLGADRVIDYTKENIIKNVQKYDLIIAVNGYHSIFDYRRILSSGGIYVMIGGSSAQIFQAIILGPLISMIGDKKMGNLMAKPSKSDLIVLKELVETGKVKPVIDRCYPLSEISEGLKYLEKGHSRGKVVINLLN